MENKSVHRQYRIVIGDSDADDLQKVLSALRNAGYSTTSTQSGNRLFQIMKNTNPHLVILSDTLKDFDGIEACKMLIEKLNFTGSILMLSSDSSERSIARAYEAGVSEYLLKPCPEGLLRVKVKLLLQNISQAGDLLPVEAVPEEFSDLQSELDLPAYRILEKIGSGSMGDVYRAMHKITFDTVAIKVVHESKVKSIRDVQRFFRGSLIGLEMPRHPNLVQIIEIKKMKNSIYQVMEYVDGSTLQTILKTNPILNESQVMSVLKDITLALDMLHQNQVLHRDVKPGNIFITKKWLCKLGDLGISRRLIDRTATTTGHIVGTPGYISPEQILDIRPLDIRSDIYSLGLTLFHAITGNNPFKKDTPYESMLARLQGPEISLNEENSPQISSELRSVINRMIRRRALDRYSSPLAILADLENQGLFDSQKAMDLEIPSDQPQESQQDN